MRADYLGYPLTDWYPAKVRPARRGLYIVGSDSMSVMMYWCGRGWRNAMGKIVYTRISWRGVDGEPKRV
jgi:hypothetical protein